MSEHGLVLVTGAAGAIGPSLVRQLLRSGYRVRALAHRPVPAGLLPEAAEVLVGDVRDRALVKRAAEGAEIVFHLAARLHVASPSADSRPEYERVNVEGTRVLLNEAGEGGTKRVVLFSTISVYGPTGPVPVDETSPPRPDTIYAETKLRAEDLALSSGLGVVLRMAAVYGPGMKGNYVALANALRSGRFVPVGSGSNPRTLVYSADAVRAAVLAAEHAGSTGRIYNVTDGSVHPVSAITAAICEALGRKPPRLSVPTALARLGAGAADVALVAARRGPRFRAAVDKYVESAAVSGERIQREVGFLPAYDLRRGWQETVRAWDAKPGGPPSVDS